MHLEVVEVIMVNSRPQNSIDLTEEDLHNTNPTSDKYVSENVGDFTQENQNIVSVNASRKHVSISFKSFTK